MEYNTINKYRSAISADHVGFGQEKAGQHPQITALLKGMFNRKPPQPRYMTTWNVDLVLNLLRTWPEDGTLSLRQISLKVTMLMALTGAMRRSELQLLQIHHMLDKGNAIEFHIEGLTKTRRVGQAPYIIKFQEYQQEPKLNVAASIRHYITRTAQIRGEQTQMLISYVKPHRAITPCSVARWLQTCMFLAGVDTSIYKAHSTRSASTSKAKRQGLSSQEIMERANWKRETTFQRYYHKPAATNTFQQIVLK